MAKVLGLLLVLGALAAAAALIPIHGRTVQDRWQAARGPGEFASRAWHEVAAASGIEKAPRRAEAARPARPAKAGGAQRKEPVESISDADRAALERVVSDRAAR